MFFRLFDTLWDRVKLLYPFIYIIFVVLLGREIPRVSIFETVIINIDRIIGEEGAGTTVSVAHNKTNSAFAFVFVC